MSGESGFPVPRKPTPQLLTRINARGVLFPWRFQAPQAITNTSDRSLEIVRRQGDEFLTSAHRILMSQDKEEKLVTFVAAPSLA